MEATKKTQRPEQTAQAEKDAMLTQIDQTLKPFKGDRAELIPALQAVQAEIGYLPEDGIKRIAQYLDVPESTAYGVATFYAQFNLVPMGRNVIKVCMGTGCYVRGAPQIIEVLEEELGIKAGETTPDMEYTLETVACFGSCALAPVVLMNDKVYGRMTPDKMKEIVKQKAAAKA